MLKFINKIINLVVISMELVFSDTNESSGMKSSFCCVPNHLRNASYCYSDCDGMIEACIT